jgi:hypothetical protein
MLLRTGLLRRLVRTWSQSSEPYGLPVSDRCIEPYMPSLLQVRLMEFSPNEKYAVSYSAEEPRGPREKASLTLNIFDTFSGAQPCLRGRIISHKPCMHP